MADVRNIEGLLWLAEVQQSDAAKWALERITKLEAACNHVLEDECGIIPRATSACRKVVRDALS